jgi:hypothetical protein
MNFRKKARAFFPGKLFQLVKTNTIALCENYEITAVKSFIKLGPGVIFIKLFLMSFMPLMA